MHNLRSILIVLGLFFFARVADAAPAKAFIDFPKSTRFIKVGKKEYVKTIEQALHQVGKIRDAGGTKQPIAILIEGGDYFPKKPLVITGHHASSDYAPLYVCAADFAKKPRIHGGPLVPKWKKTFFNGRNDVWCADVSNMSLPSAPTRLSYNGKFLRAARWPNVDKNRPYSGGWANTRPLRPEEQAHFHDEVLISPTDDHKWKRPDAGRVLLRDTLNYGVSCLGIIGMAKDILCLKAEHREVKQRDAWWRQWIIENVAEELDEPGEWYFDLHAKKVYLISPDGTNPAKAVITFANAISILTLQNCSNCTIAGFELTGSANDGVRLMNVEHVKVKGCNIHEIPKSGVLMQGCFVEVTDCDFYNCGYGVFVSNSYGDNWTVDGRMNNLIENNYIHHCHASGVWLWGQGVKIRHNLIHDLPGNGIKGFGRFCEISYNRIRHVNTSTADTGAIYDNRWSSGVETHICYNWISDSIGYYRNNFHQFAFGIYMDECSGGLHVYGNLIEHAHMAGIHLHNGRWATFSNNVFVSNGALPANIYSTQLSIQTWSKENFIGARRDDYVNEYRGIVKGDPRWRRFPSMAQNPGAPEGFSDDGTMIMGVKFFNNIVYYPDQWEGSLLGARGLNVRTNFFNRNLYWPGKYAYSQNRITMNIGRGRNSWQEWLDLGQDRDTIVADPLFRDVAKKDYRLKASSPAFALGFKELPYDKMGLYVSRFRPTLPKEAEGVREHPEWLKK